MSVRTNLPRPADPLSPPSTDTSLNFGPLRTRSVVVNHSLQSQWRGVARSAGENAHLSDKQRFLLLFGLFAIAGILIVWTLHSAPPHTAHPGALITEEHVANNPHMLKHLNQKLMSAAAPLASSIASPYSVLYVTVPNAEVAEKLSSGLLEKKLVACANIIPTVTSMYWWEGKIQKEQEQLIMLKTRSSLFAEVSAFVKANHPYQVPEVIELPIQQGHKDYLEWIGENSKDPKEV